MSQCQQICQTPSSGEDICSTTVNKPLTSWQGWLLLLLLIRFTLIRFLINCTSDCNSLPTLTHWSSQLKTTYRQKASIQGAVERLMMIHFLEIRNRFYATSYIFLLIEEKAKFVLQLIWSRTKHGHTWFALLRLWDSHMCTCLLCSHSHSYRPVTHTHTAVCQLDELHLKF